MSSGAAFTLAKVYRESEGKDSPLLWAISPSRPEQISVDDSQLQGMP